MTSGTDHSTNRQWAEDVSPLCDVREYDMSDADEKERVAAQVYQAVGVLLADAERFDDPDGIALLDACSYLAGNRDKPPDHSLLPFEAKARGENQ